MYLFYYFVISFIYGLYGLCNSEVYFVYKSLVESILTFNIVVWYENLGVTGKAKLARIVEVAKDYWCKTRPPKWSLPYSS